MAAKGVPFTEQDLQRPADEGRSLHDEVSEFYRAKLGVTTPITPNNIPKSRDVQTVFDSLTEDEPRFFQLLIDLQATRLHDLWPGADRIPPTKEGIAWHAAHCLLPRASSEKQKEADLKEKKRRQDAEAESELEYDDARQEEEEEEEEEEYSDLEEDEEEEEEEEKEEEEEEEEKGKAAAGGNGDENLEEDEEEEPKICEVCEACPCEWIEYGPDIVNHAQETFPQLPKNYDQNEVHPKIRYACYMFYTYAKYGHLGRGNRMKPSKCVQDNIYNLWPSEKRTGFRHSNKQSAENDEDDEGVSHQRRKKRKAK